MIIDALNNSRYSLTPEKMGKLVGRDKVYEHSPGGTYRIVGSGTEIKCDYDVVIYASEADRRHRICENIRFYGTGSNPRKEFLIFLCPKLF